MCAQAAMLALFTATSLAAAAAAADERPVVELGSCGFFHTSERIYQVMDFAALVAMQEGFLDDVIPNKNFKVNVRAVSTHCSETVAAEVAPALIFGTGAELGRIYSPESNPPVIGISGCGCSGSTATVSTLGASRRVAMVSGAATSPSLSEKSKHPYFARTVASDDYQGLGLAMMVNYFGWKRILLTYQQASDYGSGIANRFKEVLPEVSPGVVVIEEPLSFPDLRTDTLSGFDYDNIVQAAKRVAEMRPQPRIFLSPGSYRAVGPIIRAFQEQGLVSSETLWFLADSACSISSLQYVANSQETFAAALPGSIFNDHYDWSGIPASLRGMICLAPISQGPKYRSEAFSTFWSGLTNEKLVSAGMPEDSFAEPEVFSDTTLLDTYGYNAFIFDAMTTFLVAIGNLVEAGADISAITGEDLNAAVKAASFEGLSGHIAFDAETGDRSAPYVIKNMRLTEHGGADLRVIGALDPSDTSHVPSFEAGEEVLFADGSSSVPADRAAPCGKGYEYAASGSCAPCQLGYYGSSEDTITCSACAPGRYADEEGMSDCKLAPKGHYVPEHGGVNATKCDAGHFTADSGAAECEGCPAGKAQGSAGQSECLRCEIGSWSHETATACTACAGSLTTLYPGTDSPLECQCPEDSYSQHRNSSLCLPCPEGMACAFGASEEGFAEAIAGSEPKEGAALPSIPLLKASYFSTQESPLSVYLCRDSSGCPGGLPGVCASGRAGQVCADCPEGQLLSDGACVDCDGLRILAPVLAIFGMLAMIIGVYYLSNSPVSASITTSLACSVAAGFLVTNAQLLGTMKQLNVPWPSRSRALVSSFQVLLFDPDSVTAECLVGYDPTVRYLLRCMVPVLLVVLVLVAYGASKLAGLIRPQLGWHFYKTLNGLGTVFQIIFIALTGIVAVPFQCYTHPNGSKSVLVYPTVTCNEAEHLPLIIMALLVLLVFVVPFVAINLWATYAAYASSIKSEGGQSFWAVACRYLFFRNRPDVWWWSNVLNLRQLLLAFAPVVQPDDPASQVAYVTAVLAVYLALQCYFWPWKSHELNVLDASSMVVFLVLVLNLATIMPASTAEWQQVVLLALIVALLAFNACFLAYACTALLWRGPNGRFGFAPHFSGYEEEVMELGAELSKLSKEDCTHLLESMNTYDLQALRDVMGSMKASWAQESGGGLAVSSKAMKPRLLSAGPTTRRNGSFRGMNSWVLLGRSPGGALGGRKDSGLSYSMGGERRWTQALPRLSEQSLRPSALGRKSEPPQVDV